MPRQFNNCVAGYTKRQTENAKMHWEQTRQIMFAVLSPNLKRNTDLMKLIPLPWDEKQNDKIDLEKEIEAVKENLKYWERVDASKKENSLVL